MPPNPETRCSSKEGAMVWTLIALVIGFALGLAAAFALRLVQARTADTLARELFEKSETLRQNEIQAVLNQVKQSFGGLSLEALGKNTEQFLALAAEKLSTEREAGVRELDGKKGLIDQRLGVLAESMTAELGKVTTLVQSLENDRRQAFGEVSERIKSTGEHILQLAAVTGSLREALSSTKARGQWGERMAEDVLRAAGFIDGVNYLKQSTLVDGTRPDFTFLLPKDRTLNMDVKFPLDNYLRLLEATSEIEQARLKRAFLADVRARMKEITTRAYVDPATGTCDYVLLFIPNEGIYSFIHDADPDLLDAGLRNRVVFCSPITLFAVLAVIRLAVDQFAMEKTSNEVLALIGSFHKQWSLLVEQIERVGKRIEDASKEFEVLNGVRRRQIERPLRKIEDLRRQRGIPEAVNGDDEDLVRAEVV
jgi:DNA recombination protein RmuC